MRTYTLKLFMNKKQKIHQPVALTIAGSDSGGNAGIQADLRAFHAFGVHGCTAITALTAQNPDGVYGIQTVTAPFLTQQLDAVFSAYAITALKTGMLANAELINAVADTLGKYQDVFAVVDPVMVATSGAKLLAPEAVDAMKTLLLPKAKLITPNLPETEVLLDDQPVNGLDAMKKAAQSLYETFGCHVLVKGGHEVEQRATDILFDGRTCFQLSSPVVADPLSTHGTGCTLSAAIAAAIACGNDLLNAVIAAKSFVYHAILNGKYVGKEATVMDMPLNFDREIITIKEI